MSGWPEPRYYCTTSLLLLRPPTTTTRLHKLPYNSGYKFPPSPQDGDVKVERGRPCPEDRSPWPAMLPQTLDQCIDWRPLWAALRPSHTQYGRSSLLPGAGLAVSEPETDIPTSTSSNITPPHNLPPTPWISSTDCEIVSPDLTPLGMVPVYKTRKY